MAERSESVIGWNLPNVITILIMLLILWLGLGFLSHGLRRATGRSPFGVNVPGVTSDNGEMVA